MRFWPSLAGKCSVEQKARITDPDKFIIPPENRLFLSMGNKFGDALLRILEVPEEDWEVPGVLKFAGKNMLSGRIDAIIDGVHVELKAVTSKKFNEITKPGRHWATTYPNYLAQVQSYLMMDFGKHRTVNKEAAVIMFINRDTAEVVGGLDLDVPGYTFDDRFIVPKEPELQEEILKRFVKVIDDTVDECDVDYFCFYCKEGNYARYNPPSYALTFREDLDQITLPEFVELVENTYGGIPKNSMLSVEFDKGVYGRVDRSMGQHTFRWGRNI